ncbi:hypothetical protein ACFE04_000026 [Oxalis oulophora]
MQRFRAALSAALKIFRISAGKFHPPALPKNLPSILSFFRHSFIVGYYPFHAIPSASDLTSPRPHDFYSSFDVRICAPHPPSLTRILPRLPKSMLSPGQHLLVVLDL